MVIPPVAPAKPAKRLRRAVTYLPEAYEEDTLVLLPRDPHWTYLYWDLHPETVRRTRVASGMGRAVLRIFDVTDLHFDGFNAHHHLDVEVDLRSRHWYVKVPAAGRMYLAEIGFRAHNDHFFPMKRSNAVAVPPETVSPVIFDQFITVRMDVPLNQLDPALLRKVAEGKPLSDEERRKLFALSAGLRLGIGEGELKRRLPTQISKHFVSSASGVR